MLKFLTNKLKNHRLNEDSPSNLPDYFKEEEDHDSGTESDGERVETQDLQVLERVVMENEISFDRSSASTVSPGLTICSIPSPYFLDSALASDTDLNNDHHSSEEELEVINSNLVECKNIIINDMSDCVTSDESVVGGVNVDQDTTTTSVGTKCNRSSSVNALPEKRKWSQTNLSNGKLQNTRLCVTPGTLRYEQHSSGSSDDEVQGFLTPVSQPVEFRTSPPLDLVKPGNISLSPPPKLFHYEASPRKRYRHTHRHHHLQRPCLDFEKMQQLKARAVTAWRHNGEHGGELSVFCW